jgi:hypothetical protein
MKWLWERTVRAANAVMIVEEYHQGGSHLEGNHTRVRLPSAKLAKQALK